MGGGCCAGPFSTCRPSEPALAIQASSGSLDQQPARTPKWLTLLALLGYHPQSSAHPASRPGRPPRRAWALSPAVDFFGPAPGRAARAFSFGRAATFGRAERLRHAVPSSSWKCQSRIGPWFVPRCGRLWWRIGCPGRSDSRPSRSTRSECPLPGALTNTLPDAVTGIRHGSSGRRPPQRADGREAVHDQGVLGGGQRHEPAFRLA